VRTVLELQARHQPEYHVTADKHRKRLCCGS